MEVNFHVFKPGFCYISYELHFCLFFYTLAIEIYLLYQEKTTKVDKKHWKY